MEVLSGEIELSNVVSHKGLEGHSVIENVASLILASQEHIDLPLQVLIGKLESFYFHQMLLGCLG